MTDSTGRDIGLDRRQENRCQAKRGIERDALEQELDRALRRYAAVEPRSGLEERILANLRAQPQPAPVCIGWRWPWAGAMAVVVLVLGLSLSWTTRKPRWGKAADRRVSQQGGDPQILNRASQPHLPARALRSVKTAAAHGPRRATASVRAAPHLERFPSPQPLSEQEKMLALYVAVYPQHAALVAEARAQALRQDAVEEMRNLVGEQKLEP